MIIGSLVVVAPVAAETVHYEKYYLEVVCTLMDHQLVLVVLILTGWLAEIKKYANLYIYIHIHTVYIYIYMM